MTKVRIYAGNLWLQTGDEKVDLGLCVKHGAKGMCVPDYVQAQPDNNGWAYSQALVTVIEQYKVGAQTCSALFVIWPKLPTAGH